MSKRLERFFAEAAYEDVEKLVYGMIHKHVAVHGGDFEDLRQEAGMWFMHALAGHDTDKGRSFSSWMGYLTRVQLLEVLRQRARKHLPVADLDPDLIARQDGGGRLRELLMDLSEDARTIAGLVLDTPADLRLLLLEQRGDDTKSVLAEYLGLLGWPERYVEQMFAELEEAFA
jgi:DNA-directed RNA polymerase specialized sigma24 family protein